MELTGFEHRVLEDLLSLDHPCAAMLRRQLEGASAVRHEWTTVGFFTYFEGVPEHLRLDGPARACFSLSDGEIPQVPGVVSVVLFVDEGLVHFLEGHLTRFDWDEVEGPDWPAELRDSVELRGSDPSTQKKLQVALRGVLELFRC